MSFLLLLLISLTFRVVLGLQGAGCLPARPPPPPRLTTTTRVLFQCSSFPTWTWPSEVHARSPQAVGSAFHLPLGGARNTSLLALQAPLRTAGPRDRGTAGPHDLRHCGLKRTCQPLCRSSGISDILLNSLLPSFFACIAGWLLAPG